MSIAGEIEKLNGIRQSGALSEEEYRKAKETLLSTIHYSTVPSHCHKTKIQTH